MLNSFADCGVGSIDDINEANAELKEECEHLLGGGGVYIGKITLSTPSNTCDGIYMENAYVLRYGCNTCSSKDVQERLKQDTIACTKQCKTTMNACVYDGIFNDWGGYYNVDQHPSCSPLKNTSLSGCAESSSSQIMESSSSEEQSSSSNENSNSLEESSSSEDLDFSSSSEGDCDEDDPYGCSSASEESSSSEVLCPCTDEDGPCFDDDGICSESRSSSSGESMSSSANANVIACYEPDENGGCKFSHYVSKERPPMHGEPSLSESDIIFCEYTDNQIYVGYFAHIGNPWLIDERLVDLRSCYYDENNCGNLPPRNAPPIPMLPPPFYECYLSPMDENGCEKTEYGLGVFVDKNLQIAERTASWIPSNVTRDQIIAMGDEVVRRERSMIVHYNGEKIGTGFIDNLNPRNLASALWFCDYIINQYEREHRSSSSIQVQSSCSSVESSSSVVELSSSSEKLFSSSSDEAPESSSSFIEESSSSSVGAETFVSDGNQIYAPDQIFKDGLQNMEDGLCYSLNPERGTVNGWNISYNAQDSWWWREVDCETGEKVDKNKIGVCSGSPLGDVPKHPDRTCFAYNGKCYRCKAENEFVDCSQEWIWKWSFNGDPADSWFAEVDCFNPFERDEFICPDGSVLYKKASKDFIPEEIEEVHNGPTMYYYYDALGRSMKRKDAFSVKRAIYYKSQRDNSSQKSGFGTSKQFKVLLKTVSGYVRAKTEVSFSYNTVCSDEQYIPLNVVIELNTSNDDIEVKLEGNDANLKKHEEKHVEIYREYGNDSWVEQSFIYHRMKKSDVCKKIKEDYWPSVETRMRKMLNLQNAWDDEDVNNVSHERINIELEIEKLKKQWQNSSCE